VNDRRTGKGIFPNSAKSNGVEFNARIDFAAKFAAMIVIA
jgi:hypothetical protein